jgi:hypothetical protein
MHLSEGRPQALELTGHWEKAAAALMRLQTHGRRHRQLTPEATVD